MARAKWTEDYFRKGLKAERDRRGWTQVEFAEMLSAKGVAMHWTTVAKIESGDRSVRIDEAAVIADLLETSVDALLGRVAARGNDLSYTLRSVLNTARRCAYQVTMIAGFNDDALADLETLEFERHEELQADLRRAQRALMHAQGALTTASRFELAPRRRVTLRKETPSKR